MTAWPRPLRKLRRRRDPDLTYTGGYRRHNHMDNTSGLESEEIRFGASDFDHRLRIDMAIRSTEYLEKHYPEFVFSVVRENRRPKGHDITEKAKGAGWVVADWRH